MFVKGVDDIPDAPVREADFPHQLGDALSLGGEQDDAGMAVGHRVGAATELFHLTALRLRERANVDTHTRLLPTHLRK